ncbi:MAG: Hsp20/alpha crystallin family protein [Erysipelotrichaceae bacterium]|nr:Hsp20/alpha crystallin family protein [Erysipelotrichaceae bacterium]
MKLLPSFRTLDVFDDLFNDVFMDRPSVDMLKTDIREKDGRYILEMEVPGIKKEDLSIALKNGYLQVSAKRESSSEEKDDQGHLIRQERYSGSCSRQFYVGDHIKEDDIKASFQNGELLISIPSKKPDEVEERKYIPIE